MVRRFHRGYTLIELLVVMLIMTILMTVALPLYLSATTDSARRACRTNMQTIANAVQAARVKEIGSNYAHEIARNHNGIDVGRKPGCLDSLVAAPVCPWSGRYSVVHGSTGNPDTFRVSCSVGAHGTFDPGVDQK